ncbi:MAG: hypothetical protein EOO90_10745 [Pedobacter sp.]|nr:MAG: hypothetical protein EOO90_10745 [Pedobacter sp.]
MKKLIFMSLLITAIVNVKTAKAQNATGNASNHRVPVPASTPQVAPTIGINAVNTPALTVPSAPPLQTVTAPLISPIPGVAGSGVLPAVPAAPAPPPVPVGGTIPPPSSFTTTLNLPRVPKLPPIPAIPAMPDVRLRIGSN